MNSRRWSLLFIKLFVGVLLAIAVVVVSVDPFFHYHKPIKGMATSFEDEAYINDGISRNFTYDAMITGTSMTKGFKTEEAESLFQKEFVRITYCGEGFKRINENLEKAIKRNPDLKMVIRALDAEWFIRDENYMGYSEYPEYLYDDNIWNDTNYLYNKEILWNDVIPQIVRTFHGEEPDNLDNYGYSNGDISGKERVLKSYQRGEKSNTIIEDEEMAESVKILERNLESNVLSVIEDNQQITFYIFIPPYSICWWDSLNQNGKDVLMRRIYLERVALEKLVRYDNVRVFSFYNNYELICNLDNYWDVSHYIDSVASQILVWMKNGEYEITKDNYEAYIEEITEFYCNYDYDSLFLE